MSNPANTRKILVLEDDETFRQALKFSLEKAGYTVATASDISLAKQWLASDSFDLLISDIQLPDGDGLSLARELKGSGNNIGIVLMTGFRNLIETQAAYSIGIKHFLAKPFKKADILEAIDAAFSDFSDMPAAAPPPPEENLDDQFRKIAIQDFVSGKQMKFDIYIRLSAKKYLKIAHEGENLDIEQVHAYKSKGIEFLYLTAADMEKYQQLNMSLAAKVAAHEGFSSEKKLNFLRQTQQVILENIFTNRIEQSNLDSAKGIVELTVQQLTDKPETLDILDILNQYADWMYAHSVGVSMYAVLLARELKWTNALNLQKLSTGALLHDIGMKEIDRSFMDKPRRTWTRENLAEYESHPMKGVELLRDMPNVSGDVIQIVLQHHENCLGYGFPAKLLRRSIHPMARIVAVADEYCNLMIQGPKFQPGLSAEDAILRIATYQPDTLDNSVLLALIRLYKLEEHPSFSDLIERLKKTSPM